MQYKAFFLSFLWIMRLSGMYKMFPSLFLLGAEQEVLGYSQDQRGSFCLKPCISCKFSSIFPWFFVISLTGKRYDVLQGYRCPFPYVFHPAWQNRYHYVNEDYYTTQKTFSHPFYDKLKNDKGLQSFIESKIDKYDLGTVAYMYDSGIFVKKDN